MKTVYTDPLKLSPLEHKIHTAIKDASETGLTFRSLCKRIERDPIRDRATIRSLMWRINRKVFALGETKMEIVSVRGDGKIRYRIGNGHSPA